jgi:DNA-binding NarL/FixJ family response regulator
MATTVVIGAEDAAVREELRATLAGAGMAIAFEASGAEETGLLCRLEPPDAIVLAADPALFEAQRDLVELRTQVPDVPVVVVSTATGRRPVDKALRNGATGYVYADEIGAMLAPAVVAAAAGLIALPAALRRHAVAPVFSHRERQVLDLAVQGHTNTQIAQRLFLAESTVKSHLSACFRKLGVSSRAEAAEALAAPA